jgi:predicted ATP-grasp superfamily ATP-dependent carboligase
MKLLIFEYVTGGGFNKENLPSSLADEGLVMLKALLEDVFEINILQPTVMLDARLKDLSETYPADWRIITPCQDVFKEFSRLCLQADAVWPIAPEFDNLLENLCRLVPEHKCLLVSPAEAVAICANKLHTFERLQDYSIPTVATRLWQRTDYEPGEWIIKPVDGAGARETFVLTCRQDFVKLADSLPHTTDYILQPHLEGWKTSLSCLCKNGRLELICVNLQHFIMDNNCYRLAGITVNHTKNTDRYQALLEKIGEAFSKLRGYIGIDLIETTENSYVLEINPRLTTSFAGIRAALGINVCAEVIALANDDEPMLKRLYSRPVELRLSHGA